MATKLEQKQKELIDYSFGFVKYIPYVIDLMNEITELEKQAITDADIEAWAEQVAIITTGKSKHGHIIKAALFTGAKAVLNGEITHIEK